MLTNHTGAIVIRNGRSVSLAECEWRSNAWKTSTVPRASTPAQIPTVPILRIMLADYLRRMKGCSRRVASSTLPAMDAPEPVVVRVVDNEPEAEMACGLLRSAGIKCAYRETEAIDSALEEFTSAGPREILVEPGDLAAARELLGAD